MFISKAKYDYLKMQLENLERLQETTAKLALTYSNEIDYLREENDKLRKQLNEK